MGVLSAIWPPALSRPGLLHACMHLMCMDMGSGLNMSAYLEERAMQRFIIDSVFYARGRWAGGLLARIEGGGRDGANQGRIFFLCSFYKCTLLYTSVAALGLREISMACFCR